MKLSALLGALHLPCTLDHDPEVRQVTRDSREVRSGTAFVAVVGANSDGHDFVGGLVEGVAFVERPVETTIPTVLVPSGKLVLAEIAAILNGHPANDVPVIGVTGTNGKTTVTTLAEQAMVLLGRKAGRIGTTGNSIGGQATPTSFTTPEAPILQALLAEMRDADCEAVFLEVSSIGLAQHRVHGIAFHLAVFTNFTGDHLDFHGTMEAYAEAKAQLFQQLRPAGGPPRALLCGDDPAWRQMRPPPDLWTYGFSEGMDLRLVRAEITGQGTSMHVHTPEGEVTIESRLVGRHNALNLVAALGICLSLGVDIRAAGRALEQVEGAPGRLEVVPNDTGRIVLVDYAHSDDALATVLPAVRELTDGDVWVLFGAGGDRDRGKRPRMAEVAERLADHVVLTSDNPRSEDPEQILAEIRSGLQQAPAFEHSDRRAAIEWVLSTSRPGDVVLIAGKGHETTQEIAGEKHAFDDREVARAALERR